MLYIAVSKRIMTLLRFVNELILQGGRKWPRRAVKGLKQNCGCIVYDLYTVLYRI
jgi:hypothetical protein